MMTTLPSPEIPLMLRIYVPAVFAIVILLLAVTRTDHEKRRVNGLLLTAIGVLQVWALGIADIILYAKVILSSLAVLTVFWLIDFARPSALFVASYFGIALVLLGSGVTIGWMSDYDAWATLTFSYRVPKGSSASVGLNFVQFGYLFLIAAVLLWVMKEYPF